MVSIQFHRGNTLLSRAIRLFSPKFNHVSIKIGRKVWESHLGTGVTKTPVASWNKSTVCEVVEFRVPAKVENQIKYFLDKQVGKKYDIMGIFHFLWFFTKPKDDRWYCSELGKVVLYKIIGVDSNKDDYQQRVSPYQLWRETKNIQKLWQRSKLTT